MSQLRQPLPVSTPAEVDYYFMTAPCPNCEQGPWSVERPSQVSPTDRRAGVRATCKHCGHVEQFTFLVRNDPAEAVGGVEKINPDDDPSEVIDLAQWVALFRRFVERAAEEQSKAETRKLGYQAALCLAEALKFYSVGDEFPDDSAFFHETSREAYKRNPAMFARQQLLDLQGKLPSLEVIESNLTRDQKRGGRRWWQFWKK